MIFGLLGEIYAFVIVSRNLKVYTKAESARKMPAGQIQPKGAWFVLSGLTERAFTGLGIGKLRTFPGCLWLAV